MTSAPGSANERHAILLARLLESGQWERVLDTARVWLAEEPESAVAHRAAAQALINLKRFKLASPHLQKVLAAAPNDGFAHRLASVANFHQGRYDRAEQSAQQAIRLQPRDAMHWYHLAWMRCRHSQRAAALKYARCALELAPNNADIRNLVALCERHEPAQRLARYEDALGLDPANATIHNNVGVHYLHSEKDYSRAIEAFRRSLALDPTDYVARENLRIALRENDPIHRALQWLPRLYERCMRDRSRPVVRSIILGVAMVPVINVIPWIVFLLWMLWSIPLMEAYGFLLRHDVDVQVEPLGKRRNGWLWFWRWPRWTRVGTLFAAYAAFWVSLSAFVYRHLPSASEFPPFFYDGPHAR